MLKIYFLFFHTMPLIFLTKKGRTKLWSLRSRSRSKIGVSVKYSVFSIYYDVVAGKSQILFLPTMRLMFLIKKGMHMLWPRRSRSRSKMVFSAKKSVFSYCWRVIGKKLKLLLFPLFTNDVIGPVSSSRYYFMLLTLKS